MNNKDYALLEYLCEKYGPEIIEENFRSRLKNVYLPLAASAMITGGIGAYSSHMYNNHREPEQTELTPDQQKEKKIEDMIPHYHELVQAVKEYMNWAVNCIGHDYSEVEISPEKIVQFCYEDDYDLPMLLSALHLESHFGVTPRAKRTGSPCSIGCWDNGKNRIYYKDQNIAVKDYIKIMKRDFIRDRKWPVAFSDGNLTNKDGNRYASNEKYERELRSFRNRALRKFPILNVESQYN